MQLKDFFPGQRVYVLAGTNKIKGTAGHSFNDKGQEIIVRFDDPSRQTLGVSFVFVTEKNMHLFQCEPLN